MERTGNGQTELRHMLYDRFGISVSKGHMSGILTGRWRCSLEKAVALSKITSVPVEKLVEWPRASRRQTSEPLAQI